MTADTTATRATCTVRDLRAMLERFEPDAAVLIQHDGPDVLTSAIHATATSVGDTATDAELTAAGE